MAQVFTVRLNRQDAQPWGFRLQGGKDFATPLVVQKVNGGSLAEQAGLLPGDAVIKINGTEVFSLKHKDAQDVIVRAGNNFDVTVQRGGSTWRPTVTPTGGLPTTKSHLGNNVPAVTKTSLAHKPQEVRHIGSGFNSAARPFSTINGNDGQVKSIVNKQYNTPVGIYSEEAIAETLSAQAEVLAGGVLGVNFKKNERVYNAANSEVLKMLHEQECDPSEPAEKSHGAQPPFFSQANQQSVQQQQQQQQHHYQQQHQQHQTVQHSPQPLFNHQPSAVERSVVTRHVTAPVAQPKAPGTGGLPTGQNICSECERLIVGVFVRIKDKNLHAECFKCSTCGASLKNQGYFNLNNKLYCDIHARLAALNNPPAGTEGYDPIPIKPSATLSANTISAALNAHGIHTNGTPSLVTAPTVNHDYDLKASNTTANSIKTKHTRNLSNGIPISSSSSSSSISSPNTHFKSASSSSVEKLTPSHSRNSSFDNDGIRSFGNPNNELDGILHKMPFSIPSIIIDPTSVINNGEDNLNSSVAYNNSNVSKGISPQEQNGFTTSNTNINIANNGGNIQKEKTLAYNQFLKEYAKKKSNSSDKIDGENNKSFCSTASETPFSLTSNETMMSANDMNLAGDSNNSCSNTNLSSNGHNEESIYGSIRSETKIKPNEEFQYVTLQGNLIKSVIPPGKGIETSYKVNQGFSGPKPFSPISPSLSGPKSPSSYPPPTSAPSWSSPVSAPKPATNPYATLPRATAPTGPASQETQTTKSQETEKKSLAATVPSSSKPKKALQSGLHKADNIPQYQRNWTVLPSQRPVKTPEPPELRENVPLAFVDVPKESSPSVQKPVAVQANVHSSMQNSTSGVSTSSVIRKTETKQPSTPSVPIIIEDRSGPISMTFQSIDDLPEDHSHCHPRPFTPSLINKPAPMVPFYQTEEKLVFEECSARTSQPFDRRSVSPVPDRAKSPAPGPPPNPLSAIRQSRMADYESNAPRTPQAGSITTGQSYLGVQQSQQQQQFHQNQNTSCYQTTSQSGYKSILDKPEVIQERRIGDTTIEKREKERRLNEEQKSQTQSRMVTHVGNVQIERQRKVVEEYEHSQTAKTIEIRKSSGNETRNVGKGFVTNQARRLSGLEQEITNLTSQSQAISARAANLGGQFEEDSRFPEYKSPEAVSKFPVKSALPAYDEPQRPTYIISGGIPTQTIGPPPGFKGQSTTKQKENISTSVSYDASSVSQISSSSNAAQGFIVASGFSNTNVSNMSSATSTNAAFNQMNTNAISVPAFKASVSTQNINNSNKLTIEAQQQKQNELQFNNANNTYKPTPSSGATGFKPPQQLPPQEKPQAQKSSNIEPSVNVSDPNPASAGPSKGSYGATSAPKRGRGILNKAVGPGARVPLCGSCNTQVRGPFITALGRIWCPDHFVCVNGNCRRALQDIGFVEEKGDLYCEYCFEKFLAPNCSKCNAKIKGDCLNAIGKHFHPECFTCTYCGKLFGNSPFFLEEGEPYCEADWNELFTTKCFACGFPIEAGDRWVEALNHNYHSQCFNCTTCKKNLEGQSFYNKGGRPFCKTHAR